MATYLGPDWMPVPAIFPQSCAKSPNASLVRFEPCLAPAAGWRTKSYVMRGVKSGGGLAYWLASVIDSTASEYYGPGIPLTQICVEQICF